MTRHPLTLISGGQVPGRRPGRRAADTRSGGSAAGLVRFWEALPHTGEWDAECAGLVYLAPWWSTKADESVRLAVSALTSANPEARIDTPARVDLVADDERDGADA